MKVNHKGIVFSLIFGLSFFLIQNSIAQPSAPTIKVTPGDNCVTLTWDAVPGADAYRMYYGLAPQITPKAYFQRSVPGITTSPFPQTQLMNNATYYFIMQSINNRGGSYASSTVSVVPTATPTTPSGTKVIRPFGDSITYGAGFTSKASLPLWGGGYRGWMTLITKANGDLDYMTSGAETGGSYRLQTCSSTQFHDGYPGHTTTQMIPKSTMASNADITLVHLGTNDIFWGNFGHFVFKHPRLSVENVASTLFTLVDNLISTNTNPNQQIYLAKIINIYPSPSVNGSLPINQAFSDSSNVSIANYNNLIEQKYNALPQAKKDKVTIVDMNSVIPSSSYFVDGVHPNREGYLRMACTWIRAIKGMPENSSAPCTDITTPEIENMMPQAPSN